MRARPGSRQLRWQAPGRAEPLECLPGEPAGAEMIVARLLTARSGCPP